MFGSVTGDGLDLHVGSWIAQVIGHLVFEGMRFLFVDNFKGRSPALVDNVFQAVLLAPFFVWIETLFLFFNYRPQLQKTLKNKVGKAISEYKKSKEQ